MRRSTRRKERTQPETKLSLMLGRVKAGMQAGRLQMGVVRQPRCRALAAEGAC